MAKHKATEEQVMLWTPWGMETISRPGENLATLRRLAARMQAKKARPAHADGAGKPGMEPERARRA